MDRGRRNNYSRRKDGRPCNQPQQWRPAARSTTITSNTTSTTTTSSSSGNEVLSPVSRPDKGGSRAIRHVKLHVNHFAISFNPETTILQYDFDVKPEKPLKQVRQGRPLLISKQDLSLIRNRLSSDNPTEFPLSMTAYDGEKNIFSAIPLPTGVFNVKISGGEDEKDRKFRCTIKLVKELKLSKLRDYLSGNSVQIPREILQGMDVVMKENPNRCMISLGRSFYSVQYNKDDDLKRGLAAHRGFQQSLKTTSNGLGLCLDYSVLAFRKSLPVIDFLKEHIKGFSMSHFPRFRGEVENALKGLKVTVTHRRTKQKYTVLRLTDEKTKSISFLVEDPEGKNPRKQVSLVNYFREKYGIEITYKDVPCLDLGKNNRKNYVPMEFCILVEGQRFRKEDLDGDIDNDIDIDIAEKLKELSLLHPSEREQLICNMIRSNDGPCGGDASLNFGIKVDMDMTTVIGRVIRPPLLKLRDRNGRLIDIPVDKERCHWNLLNKSVLDGKTIQRWALIDFTSLEKKERYRFNPRFFISKLLDRSRSLGIRMEEPMVFESTTMSTFSNVGKLHEILLTVNDKAARKDRCPLQFILCVMSSRNKGYKYLKWISETKVGVVTQCCLSYHANIGKDQYLANLAIKINAKLGGSNAELVHRFPRFKGEGPVMFLGADVNHPGSRNSTSPSIAAVVASLNWPAANRYASRVRLQDPRQEKISNFGDMCLELVETFVRLNENRPDKIVLFRDGVSESQFDMVLRDELQDLRKSFRKIGYKPTITVVVAQKRHMTRLFHKKDEGSPAGNVPSGTVIDTTIVHPVEFDFYLCSHYGGMGTSKLTHYYVLWDEHNFTSDALQELIYHLCFTFARCTRSVSLVPPVYYADLAAYRGRLYHEAVMDQSPFSVASTSTSSSVASSSMSSMTSYEESNYRLHAHLENSMVFS